MKLKEHASKAAKNVFGILGASPTEDQAREISSAIEKAVIAAVLEEASRCAEVAKSCCSADRDMAHKITEEIRHANDVLIANLSSMR
jgi:hypothetical protein